MAESVPLLSLPSLRPVLNFSLSLFPLPNLLDDSASLFFILQAGICLEILGNEISVYLSISEGKLSQRSFEIPWDRLILW